MIQFQVTCIHQERISPSVYRTTFQTNSALNTFQPGQFVQLRVHDSYDPLLRRPFSIHRVNHSEKAFDLLYRIVGVGTQLMADAAPGEVFDVLGPLGNGFQYDGSYTHALIVVGGMGSAPVFFLIDELLKSDKQIILLWGARCKNEIFDISSMQERNVDIRIATEDGSLGHQGLVTELLQPFLEKQSNLKYYQGFICGPVGMLKSVQSMSNQPAFQWQVSVEEIMACGVGVCCGCAVRMRSGDFRLVCKHGPVFDLNEVVFHE